MAKVMDDPRDGTAETVLVRELEEKFAGSDIGWLRSEHARLMDEKLSPRGIRRRNWLRLQAFSYLLRANELADHVQTNAQTSQHTLSSPTVTIEPAKRVAGMVQAWLWPSIAKYVCVTRTSRRRAKRKEPSECLNQPKVIQMSLWPN